MNGWLIGLRWVTIQNLAPLRGTPLHEAARAGRPELLESGADLAARDSDGCTVLDVAKNVGNEAVVQYLTRSCAIRSTW